MLRRFIVLCALCAALGAVSPGARATDAVSITDAPTTSEFSERLTLLEFADRNDSKCEQTVGLINEMRRKNYPIQRVEPGREGDELIREFRVVELPTYVLLVDGREYDRFVVRNEQVDQVRVELMTMFVKGKIEVARRPRVRVPEPRRPFFGLLFRPTNSDAATVRGQSKESSRSSRRGTVEIDPSPTDEQLREMSDAIGRTRLEAATANVYVSSPKRKIDREGTGVAIHYNSDYQEVLFVVSSTLFDDIDVDKNPPSVAVRTYSPMEETSEESIGQCVYNDPQIGVAFVAARVSRPAAPVAFAPKQAAMKVGEDAFEYARVGEKLVVVAHEVLAVDQRRFYRRDGASENNSLVYDQLEGRPRAEGTGCYVRRNGRLYFAGLCSRGESSDECVVIPTSVVTQALLSNRNLSAVYRDQLAGKFDVSASQQEVDFVMNRLSDKSDRKSDLAQKQKADRVLDEKKSPRQEDEPLPDPDEVLEETVLAQEKSESEEKATPSLNESFKMDVEDFPAVEDSVAEQTKSETEISQVAAPIEPSAILDQELSQAQSSASLNPYVAQAAAQVQLAAAPNAQVAPAQAQPNVAAIPVMQPDQATQLAVQQQTIPQYVAPQVPLVVMAQTPDGQTAQYVLSPAPNPNAQAPLSYWGARQAQVYAASNGVLPAGYDPGPDPQTVAAYEREEEAFNAAIDALRRRALEGAEIVCIVNWNGSANGEEPKESEVVRLPKRTIADPTVRRSNVELVGAPVQQQGVPIFVAPQQGGFVPLTASAGSDASIK
ncbi:MAG: hypothetical protein IJM54_04880 [Thermoguttaceae bacterium]|nr:hypothetical protein [Thermoguttaceae bacterium]